MTNYLDLDLHHGAGSTADKACLQQKAALVHATVNGYMNPDLWDRVFTDRPCWQNRVINSAGVAINDRIRTAAGFRLLDERCTLRCVEATVRATDAEEWAVTKRLLDWLVERSAADAAAAKANAEDPDRVPITAEEADAMIVQWLVDLLDQWEKAVAEEGAAVSDGAWKALAEAGIVVEDTPEL